MNRFKHPGKNLKGEFFAVLAVVLLMVFGVSARAEENAKVSSTVAAGDYIYVYIRGIDEIKSESVIQIGAAVCPPESIAVGKLAGMEVPMRTIILVDNSKSIPTANHKDIQDIATGLINGAMPNEQFKIGTFSNELIYLSDYTSDKEAALACLEGMEYLDQRTYFSDTLYDVLHEIRAENSQIYTRVIMISDGADDNEIGYTNAEVRTLVSESGIPIYTIGVKTKNNSSQLETMFAFSRAINAEYYLLDGSISAEDVVSGLLEDQGILCVRVKPDAALLDGSNRKILLKLQTGGGTVELTASADMPFASGGVATQPEEPGESEEPAEESAIEEKPQIGASGALPTIGGNTTEDSVLREEAAHGGGFPVVIVVIAAVVLATVVIVILVLVTKKKKTPVKPPVSAPASASAPAPAPAPVLSSVQKEAANKTVLLTPAGNSGKTVGLWNVEQGAAPAKRTYLVMRSLDNPAIMYKVPINDVVHIGRSNADIVIDDRYVSGKHCDIILRGDILYIKDTGSSNGTFYENMRVYDEKPIVSGGKICIGQSNFSVELVKE